MAKGAHEAPVAHARHVPFCGFVAGYCLVLYACSLAQCNWGGRFWFHVTPRNSMEADGFGVASFFRDALVDPINVDVRFHKK